MSRSTIPLTKGHEAVVDATDFARLASLGVKWCVSDGYAVSAKYGRMHRFLLGAKPGEMVDHVNGDKLDNRRANLRIATNAQNQANRRAVRGTSKFKGVCRQKRPHSKDVWVARIVAGGQQVHLGSFDDEAVAALAYDAAARKHFGQFASLNFA